MGVKKLSVTSPESSRATPEKSSASLTLELEKVHHWIKVLPCVLCAACSADAALGAQKKSSDPLDNTLSEQGCLRLEPKLR